MKNRYIYKELASTFGSDHSAEVELVTDMETGESVVKLKTSYIKRYNTKNVDEALSDLEKLTGSGYIVDVDRILKMRHINAGLEHLIDSHPTTSKEATTEREK